MADSLAHTRHIAIIGAGPTGCYTALAIRKLLPTTEITIFDARPAPYGLVRNGIAPDHQGMKGVTRQFDRLFTSGSTRFVGDIAIGSDLEARALRAFDGVVVATGLERDRPLDVPVAPGARVIGAGQILRALNGDPEVWGSSVGAEPLGEEIVLLGAGNVALDLLRLIAKTDAELSGSDIVDDVRSALACGAVRRVTVLARGSREGVRWDRTMFDELCRLSDVHLVLADEVVVDNPAARLEIVVSFGEQVERIDVIDGETSIVTSLGRTLRADAVVTAVGFVSGCEELVREIERDHPLVVRAGGSGSGALGNLAQNRALAKSAAVELIVRIDAQPLGRGGYADVVELLSSKATSFEDWQHVDRYELGRADAYRCRRKAVSRQEMRDVLLASSHENHAASHSV